MSGAVTIIPPSGLIEGPGWQPIVTAPVDGTEVILFYPHLLDDGFVTAGYWYRNADGPSHWYADLVNGGASPPTHWMPFPAPPRETEQYAEELAETERQLLAGLDTLTNRR